ncbi:MAG: acetate--CoA ligase family protein [Aigarchaeota archaeon]|nr:acetate--CoA ligase family protein [Aigarchaeota archaeon]
MNPLQEAREIITGALESGRTALLEPESKRLITKYGISTPRFSICATEQEAFEAAERLGYPLVMKIVSPDIIHKTEVGGVKVGVANPEQVRERYREILRSAALKTPTARIVGVLVQRMAPPSAEVIVGAVRDPQFGPAVMFGLGGVFVELLNDVSFRVAPIDKDEAWEMMQEVKGIPLLTGYRGSRPLDVKAVARTLASVSRIVTELDEIEQMDLNPVMVYESGLSVVDARIILRPIAARGDDKPPQSE